jgi:REP-associated tyrosine transposase
MFHKPQSNPQPRPNPIAISRRNHMSKNYTQQKSSKTSFFGTRTEQQNTIFYATLFLQNRKCLLGQVEQEDITLTQTGLIVQECWYDLPILYPNIQLDMFIVMPNHLHGLVHLTDTNNSEAERGTKKIELSKIITDFMSISSQFVSEQEGLPAESVWHPQFETEQVMNESRLDLLRDYISDNPSQWLHDPIHPAPTAEQSGIPEIAKNYTRN